MWSRVKGPSGVQQTCHLYLLTRATRPKNQGDVEGDSMRALSHDITNGR
jgi:hypothetical protein